MFDPTIWSAYQGKIRVFFFFFFGREERGGRAALTPPNCENEIIAAIPTARFIAPAVLRATHAVAAGEIGYRPPAAKKIPKSDWLVSTAIS